MSAGFTNPSFVANYSSSTSNVVLSETNSNGHMPNGGSEPSTPISKAFKHQRRAINPSRASAIFFAFLSLLLLGMLVNPFKACPSTNNSTSSDRDKLGRIYELLNTSHELAIDEWAQTSTENRRLSWLAGNLSERNQLLDAQYSALIMQEQLNGDVQARTFDQLMHQIDALIEELANSTEELSILRTKHADVKGVIERLTAEKSQVETERERLQRLVGNLTSGGVSGDKTVR
jgi:hypothetical protein